MNHILRAVFVAIALAGSLSAQTLPEGDKGLASRYPGDVGIERDPDVIFVERFDGPSVEDICKRYDSPQSKPGMSLSKDLPAGDLDGQSMLMTHVGGKGTGVHLYTRLKDPATGKLQGYDQLYARFYVKFDKDCFPLHHMGTCLGGYNPSTPWPQGGAGEAPRGDDRFTANLETYGKSWQWAFYTYWKDMRGSPPRGQHWGNMFTWDIPRPEVPRDKWICAEIMLKMNDPVTEPNGELAYWIDGRLTRHDGQVVSWTGKGFPLGKWTHDKFIPDRIGKPFEGFQWRTDKALNINFLWTYIYITDAPDGYVSKVWFDNVVVAKKYIGPIQTAKKKP